MNAENQIILVIDDDSAFLAVIQRLLKSAGFEVLVAVDPIEGVRLFEERWPEINLVLLDFLMPMMRGDEVLERLQCLRPEVRAVMMSSCDRETVSSALEQSFRGYIQKPCTRQELLERASEAIRSGAGPSQTTGTVAQDAPPSASSR
jgi:DNA-binding response OmpR family regulator